MSSNKDITIKNFKKFAEELNPFIFSENKCENEGFVIVEKSINRSLFLTTIIYDELDCLAFRGYVEINCPEEYRKTTIEYLNSIDKLLDDQVFFEIQSNGSVVLTTLFDYEDKPVMVSAFSDAFSAFVFRVVYYLDFVQKLSNGQNLSDDSEPIRILSKAFIEFLEDSGCSKVLSAEN